MNSRKNIDNVMPELDWNGIRLFLAVAKGGSLSQAARDLGKSQSTIGRHIESLEKTLGLMLFNRTPYGYQLTGHGASLIKNAQAVMDNILLFQQQVNSRQKAPLSGSVTIATGESFARFLNHHISGFIKKNSDICLQIVTGFNELNLENNEADIAIRLQQPVAQNLLTRRLGKCLYAAFCSMDYLAANPKAQQPFENASQLNWIAFNDDQKDLNTSQWLQKNIHKKAIKLRYNSPSTMLSSVQKSHGIALLPVFSASNEKNLIQISPVIDDLKPDTWLVMNRNARRSPLIRKVSGWIVELLQTYPCFQQSN